MALNHAPKERIKDEEMGAMSFAQKAFALTAFDRSTTNQGRSWSDSKYKIKSLDFKGWVLLKIFKLLESL